MKRAFTQSKPIPNKSNTHTSFGAWRYLYVARCAMESGGIGVSHHPSKFPSTTPARSWVMCGGGVGVVIPGENLARCSQLVRCEQLPPRAFQSRRAAPRCATRGPRRPLTLALATASPRMRPWRHARAKRPAPPLRGRPHMLTVCPAALRRRCDVGLRD